MTIYTIWDNGRVEKNTEIKFGKKNIILYEIIKYKQESYDLIAKKTHELLVEDPNIHIHVHDKHILDHIMPLVPGSGHILVFGDAKLPGQYTDFLCNYRIYIISTYINQLANHISEKLTIINMQILLDSNPPYTLDFIKNHDDVKTLKIMFPLNRSYKFPCKLDIKKVVIPIKADDEDAEFLAEFFDQCNSIKHMHMSYKSVKYIPDDLCKNIYVNITSVKDDLIQSIFSKNPETLHINIYEILSSEQFDKLSKLVQESNIPQILINKCIMTEYAPPNILASYEMQNELAKLAEDRNSKYRFARVKSIMN